MEEEGAGRDREPPDVPDPPARRFERVDVEALVAEVSRLTAELQADLERLRRAREDARPSEGAGELGQEASDTEGPESL